MRQKVPSRTRVAAGAFGFLTLIQLFVLPERSVAFNFFEMNALTTAFACKTISDHKCRYWNHSDFDYLCNAVKHIFVGINSAVRETQKPNKYRKTVDSHYPLNDKINAHGGVLVGLNVFL